MIALAILRSIPDLQFARVVKLVDTRDLKSLGRKAMRVRFPPRAPAELPYPHRIRLEAMGA